MIHVLKDHFGYCVGKRMINDAKLNWETIRRLFYWGRGDRMVAYIRIVKKWEQF